MSNPAQKSGLRPLVDVLGKLWASPNTLVGLIYGLLGYLAGRLAYDLGFDVRKPGITLGNNAVQFLDNPLTLPSAALCLGNTISYGPGIGPDGFGAYGDARVQIGRHEQAHTWQYQILGPLFIPVYFAVGGLAGPPCNPLERAAQNFGRGEDHWWPWV